MPSSTTVGTSSTNASQRSSSSSRCRRGGGASRNVVLTALTAMFDPAHDALAVVRRRRNLRRVAI